MSTWTSSWNCSVFIALCCLTVAVPQSTDSGGQELFFGLIAGTQGSNRTLSGVRDAILYINGRGDLLPGHELRYEVLFNV